MSLSPNRKQSRNIDYSIRLTGVTDRISCGNDSSLQLTQCTLAFWHKSGKVTSGPPLIGKRNAYMTAYSNAPAGRLAVFDYNTSAYRDTGVQIDDGRWRHIAVVFDSGVSNGTKVYVNGVLVLSTTMTVVNQVYSFQMQNADSQNANLAQDVMTDVWLSSTKLTQAQVAKLYRRGHKTMDDEVTVVSHWTHEEGAGTSLADRVGSNTGTYTGTGSIVWESDTPISTRTLASGRTLASERTLAVRS